MSIRFASSRWLKKAVFLAIMMMIAAVPALAKTAQLKSAAKVYAKATTNSAIITTLQKGATVNVGAVNGAWVRIESGSNKGYIKKAAVVGSGKAKENTATTALQVQNRLVSKGYLKASAATGSSNSATEKAVRIFQMVNGLSVNGKANAATVKKIMSGSAKKMPNVSGAAWGRSGIESAFRKRSCAIIIDLATGARLRIRRVGGSNHLDVEPKTAKDTAILKKVYGGSWSWDSRAVLLIAGGRYYAAAMNGMPHGAQISRSNNFEGQFCIHLHGSTTHGTEKANPAHQQNVEKAIAYFG